MEDVQEPSPSADPNRLAGTEGSRDVTELLAESKKMLPRAWFEDEVIMKLLTPYTIAKTYLHEEWALDTVPGSRPCTTSPILVFGIYPSLPKTISA
ncbi:MAG: hypothetical protein ACYSUZ_01825 [Planctomycetota bacterium]|jgi:hypothetical protein